MLLEETWGVTPFTPSCCCMHVYVYCMCISGWEFWLRVILNAVKWSLFLVICFLRKLTALRVPQKHLIPGCNLSVVTFYSIKPNFYLKIKSGYRTQKLLSEEPTMQRTIVLKLKYCLTLIKPHAEMCTVTWPLFDFTNSFYSGVE